MAYLKPGAKPPEKGKGSRLSPKMIKFIEAYLLTLSPRQAIIDAGYITNNPNVLSVQLMRHPLVKEAIEKGMEERKERMNLSADYVIAKLQSIVEATEENNPQAALRGLELLGKHLGLYKDRQEISGPDGGAIEMEQKVKKDVADFTSRISRLARTAGEGKVVSFPDPRGDESA